MNVWDKADAIIHQAYPDSLRRGPGWWGAYYIPNYGILRGAIFDALKDLSDRNKEWQELFDRLPKTADGATPIPPFKAWRVDGLGEIAPFLIKELYPMHALAFGSGIERWQASCVFADHDLATEEATRRVTEEKFRAID